MAARRPEITTEGVTQVASGGTRAKILGFASCPTHSLKPGLGKLCGSYT